MVILHQSGNAAQTAIGAAATTVTAKDLALTPGAARPKGLPEPPAAVRHVSFHNLLSDLNPLQYLPVIGTLFRAITGDTIPEPLRDAGSLVVSGLIAGPIGAAMSLGELAIEKVSGINPEKIEDKMLASIGIGAKSHVAVAAAVELPAKGPKLDSAGLQDAVAWSPAQLAAYGVTTTQSGDFARGSLQGSDVLNSLELARIKTEHALVQYASNNTATQAAERFSGRYGRNAAPLAATKCRRQERSSLLQKEPKNACYTCGWLWQRRCPSQRFRAKDLFASFLFPKEGLP